MEKTKNIEEAATITVDKITKVQIVLRPGLLESTSQKRRAHELLYGGWDTRTANHGFFAFFAPSRFSFR